MIKDIIYFIIADQKFAIDFQSTPIILRTGVYISSAEINGATKREIEFEGEKIQIIDLGKILNLGKSSLFESSRLLVGDLNGEMFGLLVDKVIEIINLNGDAIEYENADYSENYIKVSGNNLRLVEADKIINNLKTKTISD
ncbi:MAG: chemotaxis protein CheW [Ignavibacteriales bacterium]|nr:chemotaxis protein CheW [Ignavibacteriales bacterium]